MIHTKQRSLAYHVYLLIIIMSVLIISLFGLSYLYALGALREQVYETNRSTLSMYSNSIDDNFQNVERFLSGFAYNDEDLAKIRSGNELERYLALSREHTKLKETLPSHSGIDGFFLYNPEYNLYASTYQTQITDVEHTALREDLKENLVENIGIDRHEWFSYQVGHRYYLLRIIYLDGSYIGAWVNIENLLKPLYQTPLGQDGMIYIYDMEIPLSNTAQQSLEFNPSTAEQQYVMVGDHSRFLAVSWPSVEEELYVVALISDASIRSSMRGVYQMIFYVVILLGVILLVLTYAMRSLFVDPMSRLVHAIQQIRDGNLGTQIDEQAVSREFNAVTHSFNEMSAEIKELKISVYEQKLKQQQIYMEYLKQQITPHFYINCLNTIYSMAGLGKNDLVRQLSKELSQHLRYTMNSQATVELGKEIEHVRNFLALTEIRYPGTLHCEISITPSGRVDIALVPPLLLQSFVENTVKHELVMGEPMFIHLSAEEYWRGSERRIHINIWDTGHGYPEDLLIRANAEAASSPDKFVLGDGKHIGIFNTIQRLILLFGNRVQIRFSNREDAGAQCDIHIPFITADENKTKGE